VARPPAADIHWLPSRTSRLSLPGSRDNAAESAEQIGLLP
jgi:hypothetical protein